MDKYRKLKISEYSDGNSYRNRPAPYIRMIGYWLEKAGFNIGEDILVDVEKGRLTITKENLEDYLKD